MREDSTAWNNAMYEAQQALLARSDTLGALRALARAVQYGPGRPDAHAMIGLLLMPRSPKYAMLELKVAIWLNPQDWPSRRDLVVGLANQQMDEQAWQELDALERIRPQARKEPELAPTVAAMEERRRPLAVVEF